ncbi:nuclear speckle splicing regulatory protein 1 [Musca vetustissima]|uniref:nuclear speckle splicing regulatory protein 1 n=1 Tax=Musca vetustissima TaxID=27455 RepID=UPI002AB62946|nr:nuclear speckle splicing regulatory protein 1 [Musca vetustissima]
MSKQYGLIIPGQQKKAPPTAQREVSKPSIFDESSSASDDDGPPQMQMKKPALGPSMMERRRAKNLQAQALAEDPTIFQYDEVYDEIENKRDEEKKVKTNEPKKPKYITKLLETAERRKLENELRVERQVQKEREAEGEQFKDKEAFVTSSYRKKLEEMRKLEEQNKRDDYLEAIGDVRKQRDLDGFYRHLYEQKMGTTKEVIKPELRPEFTTSGVGDDESEEVAYKPIKSGKPSQQRAYRKRRSSNEEEEEATKDTTLSDVAADKKQHLTNNIDADSDFSIDDSSSSSSAEDSDNNDENKSPNKKKKKTKSKSKESNKNTTEPATKIDSSKIALNLDSLKRDKTENTITESKIKPDDNKEEIPVKLPVPSVDIEEENETPTPPPKPKRDKTEIWKKRTVGEVFDAAVQRYYERKAARSQA